MRRYSLAFLMTLLAMCTIFVTPAHADGPKAEWVADGARGDVILHAAYSENLEDGGVSYEQHLKVEVSGAPAYERIKVTIGSTQFGVIITDATGYGTLSKEKFGVPDDGTGRPAGPRIDTGDMITISRGSISLAAEFVPV